MKKSIVELFISRMPSRVSCANNYKEGTQVRQREFALENFEHIQFDSPWAIQALVYDIDEPMACLAHEKHYVALPNFYLINQENGHAHAFYVLCQPVLKPASNGFRNKPFNYCMAIKSAYTNKLGADQCYSGFLCKNPQSARWRVLTFREQPFDLDELSEYVSLKNQQPKLDKSHYTGKDILKGARNNTIFRRTLKFGALNERYYKDSYDSFHHACREYAVKLNASISEPLCMVEVSRIVQQASKYIWEVREQSYKNFCQLQAFRAEMSVKKRQIKAQEGKDRAVYLYSKGLSQKMIAKELAVTTRTVRRYLSS